MTPVRGGRHVESLIPVAMSAPLRWGITLRHAQPHDTDAVARARVRAWQVDYRGLPPGECLDSLLPHEHARRCTFGSADPDAPKTRGAVVGMDVVAFATICADEEDPKVEELAALHVDPRHWGRWIGTALIPTPRSRLHAAGTPTARLWLLEGNRRAKAFHRTDGWEPDGRRRMTVGWSIEVVEIEFRRALP